LPPAAMMLLTMMMVHMTIHTTGVEALNSALFRRTYNISVSNFTVSIANINLQRNYAKKRKQVDLIISGVVQYMGIISKLKKIMRKKKSACSCWVKKTV
jgi:hypothetical protein